MAEVDAGITMKYTPEENKAVERMSGLALAALSRAAQERIEELRSWKAKPEARFQATKQSRDKQRELARRWRRLTI
jgi:hypothetical protein